MHRNYIQMVHSVAVALLLPLCSTAAAQQGYPNRPIRFITPYAPGGSTSVMARLVGQHLTERWGQNVIIDNRPGGNTVIGTETLARSAPDGYTIMLVATTHAILSSLTKTPYDPIRDFAPVATLGISPQEMLVLPKLIALIIALPLLTVFADILGVFGGMLMASQLRFPASWANHQRLSQA